MALSDTIANTFRSAGEAIGDERRARNEADAILDGAPPFTATTNWTRFTDREPARTLHLRNSCCLAYLLDTHGYCLTCPLGDAAQRSRTGRAPRPGSNRSGLSPHSAPTKATTPGGQ